MQRIAQALNVATWTISKDLSGFSPEVKTSRPKGGRPKGSAKPRAQTAAARAVERLAAYLYGDSGSEVV